MLFFICHSMMYATMYSLIHIHVFDIGRVEKQPRKEFTWTFLQH
jgi:hypothetical protein